jgi:hypothetical protein
MSRLMPTLSGAVSRIFLFLKAVRYGRHEEILPEFLLTVKNRDCSRATGFIQLVHDEVLQGFVAGLRLGPHATYPVPDAS